MAWSIEKGATIASMSMIDRAPAGPIPKTMTLRPPNPQVAAESPWERKNQAAVASAEANLNRWFDPVGESQWSFASAADGWRERPVSLRAGQLFDRFDLAEAVDRMLQHADLDDGRLEFAVGDAQHHAPDPSLFLRLGRAEPVSVNQGALVDSLARGATMILNGVVHHSPDLAQVAECLDVVYGTRTGMNAYLSMEGAVGFGPHWDNHDVLVIQVQGAKHWSVDRPNPDMPLRGFTPEETSGEEVWSGSLGPGDALWIPRGFGHRTQSGPGLSVHVTCYARSLYGTDLLDAFVKRAVRRCADRGQLVARLCEEGQGLATPDVVREMIAAFRARIPVRRRGSPSALADLVGGDRRALRVRSSAPGLLWLIDGEPASRLAIAGRLVPLDRDVAEVFASLGPVGSMALADLDAGGRTIEWLARAGLLGVERVADR